MKDDTLKVPVLGVVAIFQVVTPPKHKNTLKQLILLIEPSDHYQSTIYLCAIF